jgi:hypothetical protein
MAKFRKKPVVIEAVQWNPESKPTDMPGWFWDFFILHPQYLNEENNNLSIPTLEGMMIANPGDWIIKGVKGEFYPCKPEIFEQTYEPV